MMTNDAVSLSQDPAMRVIVGWQGSERKGCLHQRVGPSSRRSSLHQEGNHQALARMNTRWVERAMAHTLHQRVDPGYGYRFGESSARLSGVRSL